MHNALWSRPDAARHTSRIEPARWSVALALLALATLGSGLGAQDTDPEKKATALQRQADEQVKAGQLVEAEATYQQAIQLREKLVAEFPRADPPSPAHPPDAA